jgi:hypothetical protein
VALGAGRRPSAWPGSRPTSLAPASPDETGHTSHAGNWTPYHKLNSPRRLGCPTSRSRLDLCALTIETLCFGTGAQTADFSILPDAVSRPRMQHRPSSTQSEAEPCLRQHDSVNRHWRRELHMKDPTPALLPSACTRISGARRAQRLSRPGRIWSAANRGQSGAPLLDQIPGRMSSPNGLILLRHKFHRFPIGCLVAQHGHRGRHSTRATISRRDGWTEEYAMSLPADGRHARANNAVIL